MYYLKLFSFIAVISILVGCKKEPVGNCDNLRNAIISGDDETVKSNITGFINKLSSKKLTRDNLQALASLISGDCGITTNMCFECIYTNPPQSEIYMTITTSQSTMYKTADISATSSNKMQCKDVHN